MDEITMRNAILAVSAACTALAAPALSHAAGTSLQVSTTVAEFCGISLANVSGSTAAVANGLKQKIATLRLACNSSNARLRVGSTNGDLKDVANNRWINYDWYFEVASGGPAALNFGPGDTQPSNGGAIDRTVSYSEALASGVLADFSLNLCYKTTGGNTPGVPQQDSESPGSTGCPASSSQALGAPAGTYTETFTFDLSPS